MLVISEMKTRGKFYIFSNLLWLAHTQKKSAESTQVCILTCQYIKPHVTREVRGQSRSLWPLWLSSRVFRQCAIGDHFTQIYQSYFSSSAFYLFRLKDSRCSSSREMKPKVFFLSINNSYLWFKWTNITVHSSFLKYVLCVLFSSFSQGRCAHVTVAMS